MHSNRYESVPDALKEVHFLQGLFIDFDPKWYPVVGGYYIISYVLEVFTQLATNLLGYCVVQPLTRWWYYPGIRAGRSHKVDEILLMIYESYNE